MRRALSGKILIQMAVIIGVGAGLGIVDAVLRPIDLNKRAAPSQDITAAIKQGGRTGSQSTPGTQIAPGTQDTPGTQGTPGEPSGQASPTPAAGDKPFVPTPKEALPPGQVTLGEAKQAYDAGAMFIDSRSLEHFKAGHIENAIRIEAAMFKSGDPPELGLVPRSAIVVIYCSGGQCDESENVAKLLTNSGYQTVYVLHDGFPGWKALGYPTATGE
jgi:rhodanese-related sulfurtransferase